MIEYLSGAVTMGFVVAAIFFLRFWRRTSDRLFLSFALAFALLALNQGVGAVVWGCRRARELYVPASCIGIRPDSFRDCG